MKKHSKKMIAPIIITLLVVGYFIFYLWMGWSSSDEIPVLLRVLLLVVPAGFIGLITYMLVERIREIKGGEEDDLSKY